MNKMTLNTLAAMAFATMLSAPAFGQNSVGDRDQNLINMTSKGWEWELNAGLNVGGAAPLGMPRELRKIRKYNPGFNTSLE
ncbi:MAG: PorT family protein, partial [Prevotella sp.]|nr:PorT family protein [Prevotella sp.]